MKLKLMRQTLLAQGKFPAWDSLGDPTSAVTHAVGDCETLSASGLQSCHCTPNGLHQALPLSITL